MVTVLVTVGAANVLLDVPEAVGMVEMEAIDAVEVEDEELLLPLGVVDAGRGLYDKTLSYLKLSIYSWTLV